jgi:4-alpha-glucanotransferase
MRESGILLPIFSLPSEYGIGCFSKEAYGFVDQLKDAGQHKWQILPLGPTGYGDSPYQSFSTFAGNPYFIDLETLIEEGLLTKAECDSYDFGLKKSKIDYGKLYTTRFEVLHKAFKYFQHKPDRHYLEFIKENKEWLEIYSLFMVLKDKHKGASWGKWEPAYRDREIEALEKIKAELADEIEFYSFLQYKFFCQWEKLHCYAKENGIQIIGDIPIYVAFDSADTWGNPELFQFDKNMLPVAFAGCPPDAYSATGQLWGNPLYDWQYHKKTDYKWWMKRISHYVKLYDVIRIDHFRGFDSYYSIPYGEKTAVNGSWIKGPGIDFFRTLEEKMGRLNIIAEDLGFLTDSVLKLLKDTGFPGMKVIQFAFDSRESSSYLPHTYEPDCIVYTGTHDNDTTRGWFHHADKECRYFAKEYMHKQELDEDELAWDFIVMAMASVARLCVIPIQDYLCKSSDARINTPSTVGENWVWRLRKGEFTEELINKIRKITVLYDR